jgi:hypothetical protein
LEVKLPAALDACVSKLLAKWKSDPDSRPKLKKGQDLEGAAWGICRSTLKMEEDQKILLEGVGPALIAVAATAKPHLRQRGREIRLVKRNGQELVEVPLFSQGIFKHPQGKLIFNDDFFQRMKTNHEARVTDYNVHLDFRHSDVQGALAFLDADDGGFMEIRDGWLFAYGPPTDEKSKEIIRSRKWRFSSPEFYPNYESNLVQRLSADDLDEMSQEDILAESQVSKTEVRTMPRELKFGDVVITLNEADGGAFTLDQTGLDKLISASKAVEAVVKAGEDKVRQLEAKVVELTPKTEPELPEIYRVRLEQLETEAKELRAQRLREQVALTMEKARNYLDDNGRGHSPVLLELCQKALALESFNDGSEPVKLESTDDEGLVKYFRNFIRVLLETVPGQMLKQAKTEGSETPLALETGKNGHYTEDELKAELENFKKY